MNDDIVCADTLRPWTTIRGTSADLAAIRDAIDAAIATGRGTTGRPVFEEGMVIMVVRADAPSVAPIEITSPEQAAGLYGAGFGEVVRERIAASAPIVFVRVPFTGPPSQ